MKNKLFLKILIILPIFFVFHFSYGASISAVSNQANVEKNQIFTVTINTNTEGASINSAEGVLSFPTDLLNVESISTSGSVFSMWVEPPIFSNISGTISFGGGLPNGFSGSRGKILSISFLAKKTGTAKIYFSSGNVRANDGMGTDITSSKNGTTVNILSEEVKTVPKKVVPVKKIENEIDTIAPENLNVISSITKDDLVALQISSTDTGSGLDKYQISIDREVVSIIEAKESMNVTLPAQNSDIKEVSVIAYDKTGNLSQKVIEVNFPEIKIPLIIKYPSTILKGDTFEISGTSYANSNVQIFIQKENEDPKSYKVKTNNAGQFNYLSSFVNQVGTLSFWAIALRTDDVASAPSQKYFVIVNNTPFVKMSLVTIQILIISILILLLLILLFYIAYSGYYKLKKMRRRLLNDLRNTEGQTHKIFKIVKDDVAENEKIFSKKEIKNKLTKNDTEIIGALSKDVDESEKYLTNKIKNIEEKDL